MLTKKQTEWLNHLSDTDKIEIFPYNPKSEELFETQKAEIQNILGPDITVAHRGATSLGISGQNEIDIYIPVQADHFDNLLIKLTQAWGKPGSLYPNERARFNRYQKGVIMQVFLIKKDSDGWKTGLTFENYLKSHPEALNAYAKLKEAGKGLSTRKYYKRKIEFINKIVT